MSKCCAIMQPTYLPWAGYFNLMGQVDYFVFLDDVQFEKQSWQNRNRILINNQPHWLTVPVKRLNLSDKINEILVDEKQNWRHKHIELIRHTYTRHPYVSEMVNYVTNILNLSTNSLCELNIAFITETAKLLNIQPRIFRSSELKIIGTRSERLLKICEHFECATYISPQGAAEYLNQDGVFSTAKVGLKFQEFEVSSYAQYGNQGFVSHLSIIDVLANLGIKATQDYVIPSSVKHKIIF